MDVTRDLLRYREIARLVWNSMVDSVTVEEMDYDREDEFHAICTRIFRTMVCDKLDIEFKDELLFRPTGLQPSSPIPKLFVEPNPMNVSADYEMDLLLLRTIDSVTPVRLGREVKSAGVIPGAATLPFVAFYDFESFQFRDFRYVMVLVQEFKARPDLEGFLALLPANEVRFVMRKE